MKRIDRQKHKISESLYSSGTPKKTQIVIASSLRKGDHYLIHMKNKDNKRANDWNTYTIARDGKIYEHFDPKHRTHFLGINEADKQTISIVFENMGGLVKTKDGKYVNWLNEECDSDNVVEKKWMTYNYWEFYTDEQIESAVYVCKKLCKQFKIPKEVIHFHHYHQSTIDFHGIVLRSNYIDGSTDTNPLFDITKFNELLNE
jgi:N-acetyl-anhydromuramyl-L-alanine amidase AmpD